MTHDECVASWLTGEISRMRQNAALFADDPARLAACQQCLARYEKALAFYQDKITAQLDLSAARGRVKSDALAQIRKAWSAGLVTTTEYRRRWACLADRAKAYHSTAPIDVEHAPIGWTE